MTAFVRKTFQLRVAVWLAAILVFSASGCSYTHGTIEPDAGMIRGTVLPLQPAVDRTLLIYIGPDCKDELVHQLDGVERFRIVGFRRILADGFQEMFRASFKEVRVVESRPESGLVLSCIFSDLNAQPLVRAANDSDMGIVRLRTELKDDQFEVVTTPFQSGILITYGMFGHTSGELRRNVQLVLRQMFNKVGSDVLNDRVARMIRK